MKYKGIKDYKNLTKLIISKPRYKVAVVIPTHKHELNYYERISLERCTSILTDYPIYLIVPEGLSTKKITRTELKVKYLPSYHFSSYRNYNNLIRSANLYKYFLDYEYILLHELDAFVFSDQLLSWCNKNYDYIGAPLGQISSNQIEYFRFFWPIWARIPWIRCILKIEKKIFCNGGFSLRRTRKFYSVALIHRNKISIWGKNDDLFWSAIAPFYFPFIKTPDENECLKFSYMLNVEESIVKHDGVLPFGCHGWFRYETDVWKNIFYRLGYAI